MYHAAHWTLERAKHLLELIASKVYICFSPLPSFRYGTLDGPNSLPPVCPDVDDSQWELILPKQYWGSSQRNFVLQTWFAIPEDWDKPKPIALYLPFGDANDFSHPQPLYGVRRYGSNIHPSIIFLFFRRNAPGLPPPLKRLHRLAGC